MVRFRVEIVEPTPFLREVADARATFEHVWGHIPQSRPRHLWKLLHDEGLFIKGHAVPVSLSRTNFRRGRRIPDEFKALADMHASDLPVPQVVAWGVERKLGFNTRAFLVERLVAKTVDLERYLLDGTDADQPGRRLAVFRAVGRQIRRLHTARCFHRDLSNRNVLLGFDGDKPVVTLIDCPRAAIGTWWFATPGLRRGDLYRITRSCLRDGASTEEVTALLRATGKVDPGKVIRLALDSLELGRRRPWAVQRWFLTGL